MKKLIVAVLSFALLFSAAAADLPDLTGMSFDDLVALREQLNLAIWNSQEWQEVTVPAGVWIIGKDIPAGHWTIRPMVNSYVFVCYCDRLDEFGAGPAIGWHGWSGTLSGLDDDLLSAERREVDLEMVEGMYFLNHYAVIFTPYTGKPDLGFR